MKPTFPRMEIEEGLDRYAAEVDKELATYRKAQKEYANDPNIFANFNRIAERLGLRPQEVLIVYAMKHWDGILSWLDGNETQREDVSGRIEDLRVYLQILNLMNQAYDEGLTANEPQG